MPSLVVEMVAAVARETLVALNGDGLDSVLLRERWQAAMEGSPSVIAEAVEFLAGYGLYLTDSQHRTTSRILSALRRDGERQGGAARLTEPWKQKAGEQGRETSLTSPLGRGIAGMVAEVRARWGDDVGYGNRAMGRTESWRAVEGVTPSALAKAAKEALARAAEDRKTDCELVGARVLTRVREDWPDGHMQDPMVEYLDKRADHRFAGREGGDARGATM